MRKQRLSSQSITTIIIAIIGVIGSIAVAYFTFRGNIDPIELSINATQTAEGKLLAEAQLPASTIMPKQTQVPTEIPTLIPTITPTLTPALLIIADTSSLVGWVPNFESSNGANTLNKVDTIENAIEITYDVGKDGFVIITKSINSRALSDTEGISFSYKGKGASNSIEFKLLLRYPGDSDDTTYGILWNRATDTGGKWTEMEVLYSDMWCWWPEANCKTHGDLLDTTMVDRLDFVVVNKGGDDKGSGWVLIKDVLGIRP